MPEAGAGIFEQSMGARNQVGIGFSYLPARLHRLAESLPWNRFLGFIEVSEYRLGMLTPPVHINNFKIRK
jgi:hypothetical protein